MTETMMLKGLMQPMTDVKELWGTVAIIMMIMMMMGNGSLLYMVMVMVLTMAIIRWRSR